MPIPNLHIKTHDHDDHEEHDEPNRGIKILRWLGVCAVLALIVWFFVHEDTSVLYARISSLSGYVELFDAWAADFADRFVSFFLD